MTDNQIVQQALEAYAARTERERARAAEHESGQAELRAALIREQSSVWSANAAFTLFDKNQPSLVDVEWTIPTGTTRTWDLVDLGTSLTAQPKNPDGTADKFIVTASIGNGISLVLELSTPSLEPTYEFLAVKDDHRRDHSRISSLSDLGAAIARFRQSDSASR